MQTCPQCNGAKTVNISVHSSEEKPTYFPMSCPSCDGQGVISDEQLAEIKAEQDMWCSCGNPSQNAYYVPDNTPHGKVRKHHYCCNDCHKIVQIG